jgi:hypothetical protein
MSAPYRGYVDGGPAPERGRERAGTWAGMHMGTHARTWA